MINVLRNDLSVQQLSDAFAAAPLIPLLPPMLDPAWQRVGANPLVAPWKAVIRERALSELTEALPILTDELYADVHLTGNRLRFEQLYFERRRRVARAAMALLTEPDSSTRKLLADSLVRKTEAIFAECSWSLPAHVRDKSGKDPMRIDLFAGETANLFGELLNVFSAVFSDDFRSAVRHRLSVQFFENYLANPPQWTTFTNNWNAVCHQGVLGSALAVCEDPEILAKLFHQAREPLLLFLSGFSADGGSSEGPGYWGYGFGWFAELNRQLETRTRGQLSLFEGDEHIRAIATFGPRMTLSGGLAVNFSDSDGGSSPRPALLEYLADRLDDPFIRSYAAVTWQRAISAPFQIDQERSDLLLFSRQFLACPAELAVPPALPVGDIFLPDLNVAVLRFVDDAGHLWEFACKGGHNDEHHNHNDVGSYLLNIDGHRLLIEIGAPEYVKSFFESQRYTFIAARSLGHPVPLINQQEQPDGKQFHATLIARSSTATGAEYQFDLTSAYPDSASCTRCVRSFKIDKPAGILTVTDSFELTRTDAVETALITDGEIQTKDGSIIILKDNLRLQVTFCAGTRLKELQTHEYSNHNGQPACVRRIALVPTKITPAVTVGYQIQLA